MISFKGERKFHQVKFCRCQELRDYDVTVVDLQMPSFAVAVKCKGVAEDPAEVAAVPCYKNNEP